MSFNRVIVSENGDSSVLQVVKDEILEPKPNEVQVKVLASGVAPGDIYRRKKPLSHAGLEPPYTIGYDIAGEVITVGENVKRFTSGQKVIGFSLATEDFPDPNMGGYTEYVNIPAIRLVEIAESVDPAKAVAIVLNYITAYYSLFHYAKPKKGERMLVHGGSGGVGSAALDLGKLANLEMYATASKSKEDVVKLYGATPIDYKSKKFVDVIKRLTNNTGVDIVLDSVSAEYTDLSFQLLREGGRYVSFGWQGLTDFSEDGFNREMEKLEILNSNGNKKAYAYFGMEIDSSEDTLYQEYLSILAKLLEEGKLIH